MKLQQGASLIEIALIDVEVEGRDRQDGRKDGQLDVSDIQSSIAARGLLHPIIVSLKPDGRWKLETGERRLTAVRNLGQAKILARKASDLSPTEAKIIELEENIKRKNLEWQEQVKAVAHLHALYLLQDPEWTQGETAAECNLTSGTVSLYLSVNAEMDNPRVANAGTVREADNMLKRRNQREAGAALEELLATPDAPHSILREDLTPPELAQVEALRELGQPLPKQLLQVVKPKPAPAVAVQPTESILNLSFLDWAPTYSGPKFNLLHCDFPYGVELFSGPQGRGAELGEEGRIGYKDSADVYETLIRSLCSNLDRVMSVSAHMMFWLSADLHIIANTVRMFNELAPSLKFVKFPLIWVKSDNAGIASDPKHGPRHVYEACLLASRGGRNIARVKGDAYSAPTDKKLHPSTKPEPMLRHFMEMLVDDTTIMLDPTCGSGASLRAAESLGAKVTLGLEIDPQFVGPARQALKAARVKRLAERTEMVL